jgi:cytochrome c-type biogenesis protein CcmH/NrfG
MTAIKRTSIGHLTNLQSNSLAVACLLAGIGAGWFIRGSQGSAVPEPAPAVRVSTPLASGQPSQTATPARLKEIADGQAAPLLQRLKADPQNPELLTGIGNLYYDAQQYPVAIEYYGRALKANPADAAVRTDMATAHWYMGNADLAIAEFDKALTYQPTNPNTLFNRGLVKLRGKKDKGGAIADWEKLLSTNPGYPGREKVEQMIAEAKR